MRTLGFKPAALFQMGWFLLFAAIVGFVLDPSYATATNFPIFVDVVASGGICPSATLCGSNEVDTFLSQVPTSPVSVSGGGSGDAGGGVTYGSSATSTATFQLGLITGGVTAIAASSGPAGATGDAGPNVASADLIAQWQDSLFTFSNVLPLGSPALFDLSMKVILTASCANGGGADASASLNGFSVGTACGFPAINHTFTLLDHSCVGCTIDLNAEVDMNAIAGSIVNADPSAGSVDPSLQLFVTSLTRNVGFQSASGATYKPTVPEPATLALIIPGLLGLIGLRWRKLRP